jgi:hypothetical protein
MSNDPTVSLAAASLTFSILSFITIVIGLLFLVFPGWIETIKTATSGFTGSSSGGILDSIKVFAVLGGALAPDIVLLIGFISDLMNMKFRYSVTSLIGIAAVVVHWGLGSIFFGSGAALQTLTQTLTATAASLTPTAPTASPASQQLLGVGSAAPPPTILGTMNMPVNSPASSVGTASTIDLNDTKSQAEARKTRKASAKSAVKTSKLTANKLVGGTQLPSMIADKFNPCAIRGLGMFDVKGSPMGLAALAAVFMVYFLDMTAGKKRTGTQVGGYLGFSTLTLLFNIYAYREFGCFQDPTFMGILKSSALPLSVGLAAGGIGYSVLSSKFVDFLPLDGQVLDTGAASSSGSSSVATGGKASCSAPNSEDQMVCEAYQDGKRITSVVAS